MNYDRSSCCVCLCCFFFFKQKTAYEIGTGDWSSDVCSSDLDAGSVKRFSDMKRAQNLLTYQVVSGEI